MARILYLGDEVTAAGFRLAGVETRVTEPADATATLRDVRVSIAAPSALQALLGLFDGVLSDGPDGPREAPVFWQDEAEWLQRGRLPR